MPCHGRGYREKVESILFYYSGGAAESPVALSSAGETAGHSQSPQERRSGALEGRPARAPVWASV